MARTDQRHRAYSLTLISKLPPLLYYLHRLAGVSPFDILQQLPFVVYRLDSPESRQRQQLHLNTEPHPQLLQIASMISAGSSRFRRLIICYLLKCMISILKLTTG